MNDFLDLLDDSARWRTELEDWNVERSSFLEAERDKAVTRHARKVLREALQTRFGATLPADINAALDAETAAETLDRWITVALTAPNRADVRRGFGLP